MNETPGAALSLPHRVWRLLPAGPRRRMLAGLTALAAPRPARPPLPAEGGIIVAGELSRPSGLGEAARRMQGAIEALGVPTWPLDLGDDLRPRDLAAFDAAPAGAPLLLHVNAPTLPLALLRLGRARLGRRRIIGYWAWELPTVPPSWRAGVGLVHDIWVLSHYTAAAIRSLVPPGGPAVTAIPIPLAVAPPVADGRGRASFGLPEDVVVVLTSFSLASSFARKNPLGAIAAFRAAFADRADRLLLLKVGQGAHHGADMAAITAAIGGAGNIRLMTETLPAADNLALTACADIVLSLHRAEGFGLVPAEAMLLGRPVVATGWSGNLDFMDEESAALVPFRLVPARDPRGVFEAPGAEWAEPDVTAAAAALRRLADDPAERAALGARGRAMATARLGLGPVRAAVAGLGLVAP